MLERIKKITAEILGIDAEAIKEETNFKDDLHADSIDLVQLAVEMENEFGIFLADEQISEIKTVGDILRILKEKGE